jgi:hypothetical protein
MEATLAVWYAEIAALLATLLRLRSALRGTSEISEA